MVKKRRPVILLPAVKEDQVRPAIVVHIPERWSCRHCRR